MTSTTWRSRGMITVLSMLTCMVMLQGCAGGSADVEGEPHDSAVDDHENGVDPQESAAPSVSEPPHELSNAACLIGSWNLQNDSFEAAMMSILQSSPDVPAHMKAEMTIELSGGSYIRFAEDDLFTAWQDAFTMTMSAREGSVRYLNESDDAGHYVADDENVWVYDIVTLHTRSEMIIDGVGSVTLDSSAPGMASVDFFGVADSVPGVDVEHADGVAGYTCSDEELILVGGGASAAFTRTARD